MRVAGFGIQVNHVAANRHAIVGRRQNRCAHGEVERDSYSSKVADCAARCSGTRTAARAKLTREKVPFVFIVVFLSFLSAG